MAEVDQALELISGLVVKTRAGDLTWERSPSPNRYSTRLGAFHITIGLPFSAGIADRALIDQHLGLSVQRLDGSTIVQYGQPINALAGLTMGISQLSNLARRALGDLWRTLDGGDAEISELLRLLK